MFTQININDFRALKNQKIQLGKYITMLAGWNATGKSTILTLLANSTELKPSKGKTYHQKPFRAEFSEILKGSKEFDKTSSDRLEITWEQEDKKTTKTFRTTWQKENNKDRFRVIPKELDAEGKKTEAKFEFPVIYLGLSRLFPIGETEEDRIKDSTGSFDSSQDEKWFRENHQEILSAHDKIKNITNINFQNIGKNSSGINTDCYDWKTNSSGQDNLSQILFAILSFKKLHQASPEIPGGLLVIDELEASLHPKAQEKIINLLIKEAKANHFQVVFTTHSLTIMENITKRKRSDDGNIMYYFFSRANNQIEIKSDISFQEMKEDLFHTPYQEISPQRIVVYTEDDEARWFLLKLLRYKIPRKYFNLLNVHISCSSLIDLMNCDPSFGTYLVVFDGDLSQKQKKDIKKNKQNYLTLPTNVSETGLPQEESPEACLENFIFSEQGKKYLAEEHKKHPRVKYEFFDDNRSSSCKGEKKRDKYKNWFRTHKALFEKTHLFNYWQEANQQTTTQFVEDFKKKFNRIAEKLGLEKI